MKSVCMKEVIARSGVCFGTSGARGLVSEMTDEVCYAYVAAFLQTVTNGGPSVVLGHDLRPSSPRIASACAAAIVAAGKKVLYAGALPTPSLAFYAAQIGAPVVVVTGSHIPFDRNGIKFYHAKGEITKQDEQDIINAALLLPDTVTPCVLKAPDACVKNAYIDRYLDFFGREALLGLSVAVYEHSSVARDVLRTMLEGMGARVISLGRADTFVPIDTEAVRSEDVVQAAKWAAEYGFDAILSTDGDADRPLIGDEQGSWFRGDVVGILCAQFLGARVVVTPVSCNTAVEQCGSFEQVVRTRIGSPYVIADMEEALSQGGGVVVGYEANGGFLQGSDAVKAGRRLLALPTRDAVLPMLALLVMARQRSCKLSELMQGLPARFTASDRIQDYASEKSRELIARLLESSSLMAKILAPQAGEVANVDQTDGLRVTFASGEIVHLRPSGNAPELRCYAEADTADKAKILCESCLKRVAAA